MVMNSIRKLDAFSIVKRPFKTIVFHSIAISPLAYTLTKSKALKASREILIKSLHLYASYSELIHPLQRLHYKSCYG